VLWAWERPEKLDYLDANKVGVAFLSQTLYLRGPRVVVRPRLQPLKLRAQQPVIAVTRIESEVRESPLLDQSQLDATVREIAMSAHLGNVVSVQIDFDAKTSERNFYRQLIFDLRRQLPDTTGLSITALASWCSGDNWLDDLPIDEAVPMLFRMGLERQQILSQVRSNEEFRSYKCRQSMGISLDEPITDLRPGKRIYVFNPASWSESSVNLLLK
jgi:hypothetical protein